MISLPVFGLILFAAALHASWNAFLKGSSDTLLSTTLVMGGAALIAVVALPFLPAPAPASWPWLAVSAAMQVVYLVLLVRIYHTVDMSLAYPLMRGSAPLTVALISTLWLGEVLPGIGWIGIATICIGILAMAMGARGALSLSGLAMTLVNAAIIAAYTLIDGVGARASGTPAAYTLWLSLLTGIAMAVWAIPARGGALVSYARRNWHVGLIGGLGTIVSYTIALWAMTMAPIAMVAALRETSILFATAISAFILRERVGPARITAAAIIAGGTMLLRLA
ncbi:DMT family transporter [Novosphingobium sp. PASSN1]|uniref:DMT family transporter n=1 Tax=Novosphingobium sp. PASSN1 TaxID=2015561 RepID=UPI0025D2D68F|nr:DMT family transporter [Novosphingobium sp. PASSN1]